MYKPKAVPVLTGKNAERFYAWQKQAANEDAGFDVKAALARMKAIIARTNKSGR